jgi:hypothetical protein
MTARGQHREDKQKKSIRTAYKRAEEPTIKASMQRALGGSERT